MVRRNNGECCRRKLARGAWRRGGGRGTGTGVDAGSWLRAGRARRTWRLPSCRSGTTPHGFREAKPCSALVHALATRLKTDGPSYPRHAWSARRTRLGAETGASVIDPRRGGEGELISKISPQLGRARAPASQGPGLGQRSAWLRWAARAGKSHRRTRPQSPGPPDDCPAGEPD